MRIYTRTGDTGTTAIHGGIRVPKTDIRIEANGCIDELNVAVGTIRTSLQSDHEWQSLLREIQLNLMTSMSIVATQSDMREKNPNSLPDDLAGNVEKKIEDIDAERELWRLHEVDAMPEEILKYLNRLSDLFFIMARFELQQSEHKEEIWREFGYKRKLK